MQVRPLAEIRPEDLDSVLKEEADCWASELHWDYHSSAQAIRQCVAAKSLQGHVLRTDGGEVCGYCYYMISGRIGYIGNFYVRRMNASPESYRRLLAAALALFAETLHVERIESQIVPFNCDLASVFRQRSFRVVRRRFLFRRLAPLDRSEAPPGNFSTVSWDSAFAQAVARVMWESYQDSEDASLCWDYQSLPGCRRFLHNLVFNSGCGAFSGVDSLIALDSSGTPAAALLASRISAETGMISQLSVGPEHQGKGLGTFLLRSYLGNAFDKGLRRAVLCVTDNNEGAWRIYRKQGFEDLRPVLAFVWNRDRQH